MILLLIHSITIGKKECWKSALQLLSSPFSYIRYFSANILYNKVRKDYHQLDDNNQEKIQFIEAIIQLLVYLLNQHQQLNQFYQFNEERIFIHRIIYTLCHACIRGLLNHDGVDIYFNTILSLFQYDHHYDLSSMLNNDSNNNNNFLPKLILGLHMLIIIPDEVDTAIGLAHNDTIELKEKLGKSIDLYSSIIDQLAYHLLTIEANNNNNTTTLPQSSSISSSSLDAKQVKELYLCVLRYTKSWLCYGMTLSRLYTDHRYV